MPSNTSFRRQVAGLVAAAFLMVNIAIAATLTGPYPVTTQAPADIKAAIAQAAKEHKRVLLAFGANWCGDCKALDANLHKPENTELLGKNYELVHINIGDDEVDPNVKEIATKYGVNLDKGIPALAVLASDGHLVFSQKNGEFESMRKLDPQSVNDFLTHWKQ